jgi:hypothetical protein
MRINATAVKMDIAVKVPVMASRAPPTIGLAMPLKKKLPAIIAERPPTESMSTATPRSCGYVKFAQKQTNKIPAAKRPGLLKAMTDMIDTVWSVITATIKGMRGTFPLVNDSDIAPSAEQMTLAPLMNPI